MVLSQNREIATGPIRELTPSQIRKFTTDLRSVPTTGVCRGTATHTEAGVIRESKTEPPHAEVCPVGMVQANRSYGYPTAIVRRQQRLLRRDQEQRRRGAGTRVALTGYVLTPVATSRRSGEIPLYLVKDTRLPPRTTSRIWVQTANRCVITEPVYCRVYPAIQQCCCVVNGVWHGAVTSIPILVTNVTDRTQRLRAMTLVAIADSQMTIPMHVAPVEAHARGG